MIQRIIICGLLIIGLNQSLLVQLAVSWQRSEGMPMKAVCACDPDNCMCPPSSDCEHNQPQQEATKEISICRLSACGQRVTFHAGWDRDIPILAYHAGDFVTYPLYSRLEFLLTGFASQLYPSPLDKPPQTRIT